MFPDILWTTGLYPNLTSFFSLAFLAATLPIIVIGYSLTPDRYKKYALLIASYIFFWMISGILVLFLLISTLSIYFLALQIDKLDTQFKEQCKGLERQERKALKQKFNSKKLHVALWGVAINLGILLVIKYSGFFMTNMNLLIQAFNFPNRLPIPRFIMPIGISFYTLQALSYLLDVYRGKRKADHQLGRVALFLSFFPLIVEGPICRYDIADQLWNVGKIQFTNLKFGIQRILYGMLKKIVIADRLNTFVNTIFTDYAKYPGGYSAIAAVAYTVQLYMDFSGSMDAVIGIGEIFGVTLPENFRQPFFSRSISEFWTRWHISLGTWFKDYIFYPLSMTKPLKNLTLKARKKLGTHYGPLVTGSIALLCVWLANGLWHGAAWHYIVFGLYHYVMILTGNLTQPLNHKIKEALHITPENKLFRAFQCVRTSILVVIGELIFRADSMPDANRMLARIVTDFTFTPLTEKMSYLFQIDHKEIILTFVMVGIIFVVSILKEKGIHIRKQVDSKPIIIRWTFWYMVIFVIIIFGAYGLGHTPVDPMYADF